MRIMCRARRGGKSYAVYQEMKNNPETVLLVMDAVHREFAIREAQNFWVRDAEKRIFTVAQRWRISQLPRADVIIDNLDMVLPMLLDITKPVTLLTATAEMV